MTPASQVDQQPQLPSVIDRDRLLRDLDRADCEDSLATFLRYAWPYIDAAPYVHGWPIDAMCEHLQAVVDGEIRNLIINVPPRSLKSSLASVCLAPWVWAQRENSPTSGPSVQFMYASYAFPLAVRDSVKCRRLIASPWYQALWGDRFMLVGDQNTKGRFANDKRGERLTTSVGGTATGEGGAIIVVDDPNAANEVLSAATTEATNEWWDGTMSTRLNDPKTGAKIIIQQRLGEDDLTGHVLEKELGWTHLMLPMEYEPERSFVTSIGWKDPRTEPGELLFPDRFGAEDIAGLKRTLGSFRCNPADAPILMADLSMKPLGDVRVGDEVVGFQTRFNHAGAYGRQKLVPTVVTEVHELVADLVRITLDSGEVIRCTPDHKWFTKDRGPTREKYLPATLRSRLARVCPPQLPALSPEDQRDAGWLAGFFDGEGSVTLQRGTESRPRDSGSRISFYQGAGRNLPLCEKLERLLTKFGFEFSYTEDERKPNKDAPCYGYRAYSLRGGGLPLTQRFLHIVQPSKWRDRIIAAAWRSNFIRGRERVVSIEPAGSEKVFGLTTTTGNYVAWGLASSNSAGQLQQRPEPKGGGIIKRDHWKLYDQPSYPPMDLIVAALDTAFTEDTQNDYSAMTVWGVFSGADAAGTANRFGTRDNKLEDLGEGVVLFDKAVRVVTEGGDQPKVMMMSAWQERLELHALVIKVADTCRKMRVDRLLIENKAAGHSVQQELRRLYAHEDFGAQLDDPKGQDKVARLYSVQHLFEEGMVLAPDRAWAETVIAQCAMVPNAKNDDLADTVSMALRYLRRIGVLIRSEEWAHDVREGQKFKGRAPTPLYPTA